MFRFRNHWTYSASLAIVWAIILLILAIRGSERMQTFLLVFGGYCLGWVSTTIARAASPR